MVQNNHQSLKPEKWILLALAYIISGWLGLQIATLEKHITLVWFPSGIALAGLMILGRNAWPAIFIGAFCTNALIGSSLPLAASIAASNTLAPLLSMYLLRRGGLQFDFSRTRDVLLLLVATVAGMAVSASGGVFSLWLAGNVDNPHLAYAWLNWWQGDCAGVLLVTPQLLSLTRKNLVDLRAMRLAFSVWLASLIGISLLIFLPAAGGGWGYEPKLFLTVPFLVWGAVHYGMVGASFCSLLFSVAAAGGAAWGRGPFIGPDQHANIMLLWSYMVIVALTGLLITALLGRKLTVEHSLRENEEKLRTLFNLSPIGIALTDMQGRYIEFNEAFRQICGYSAPELLALDYWRLTPASYAPQEAQQLDLLRTIGRYGPYQKEYIRKDGSQIPIRLAGCLVTGGDGTQYIWSIVEDISEQKAIEAELRQAKAQSDAANQAKSRFLAAMSHEIRTPLNGILGMAQLLLLPDISDSERGEYTRTIINSGRVLLVLLNDILDASKIEAGQMQLKPHAFNPTQLMRETTNLFYGQSLEKRLDVQICWHGDSGQRYRADMIRLRQMLTNLISNAIKFTPHGFIRVEGRELQSDDGPVMLEFSVTDSGIGIPAAQMPKLFSPFFQVDNSSTREYGGTGLGLSIVQQLAQLMGGHAAISSEPGQGTRASFIIRAEPVSSEEESRNWTRSATGNADGSAQNNTAVVLIVDDNPTNRLVAITLLTKLGYTCHCAENGRQALELLEGGLAPGLILMDCQMPVMDGYQATRLIRKQENQPGGPARIPILALTAALLDEDRAACLQAGMDDMLTKPLNVEQIKAAMAQWLPLATSGKTAA